MPDKRKELMQDLNWLRHSIGERCGLGAEYTRARNVLIDAITFINSGFPPPAEDARKTYRNIQKIEEANILPATGLMNPKVEQEASAEISRFAESRVEPWREAARAVIDVIPYGNPECTCAKCEAIRRLSALLSDSPAKEADR